MLKEMLAKRNLPPLLTRECWETRRAQCLDLLLQEEYGYLPKLDWECSYETVGRVSSYGGGKGTLSTVQASLHTENGDFTFPFSLLTPKGKEKTPAFVFLSFRSETPNPYWPAEEICEEGFSVASVCYKDVTSDDGDFTNGLARLFYSHGVRTERDAGKLMLWAFAASRVMDYLVTRPEIDPERIAVMGHSRLGKTALLAGALDKRFFLTVSNDSGCGGAAISRGKVGESIAQICDIFPFWFSEHFASYSGKEDILPIDQHMLTAMAAPRLLYIASASEDQWADPVSEFLGGLAAGEVYALYGKQGLCHANRLPVPGDRFHAGCVGYHLRPGDHFLNRDDWKAVMAFFKSKL